MVSGLFPVLEYLHSMFVSCYIVQILKGISVHIHAMFTDSLSERNLSALTFRIAILRVNKPSIFPEIHSEIVYEHGLVFTRLPPIPCFFFAGLSFVRYSLVWPLLNNLYFFCLALCILLLNFHTARLEITRIENNTYGLIE